jgi:hypothetical protein
MAYKGEAILDSFAEGNILLIPLLPSHFNHKRFCSFRVARIKSEEVVGERRHTCSKYFDRLKYGIKEGFGAGAIKQRAGKTAGWTASQISSCLFCLPRRICLSRRSGHLVKFRPYDSE